MLRSSDLLALIWRGPSLVPSLLPLPACLPLSPTLPHLPVCLPPLPAGGQARAGHICGLHRAQPLCRAGPRRQHDPDPQSAERDHQEVRAALRHHRRGVLRRHRHAAVPLGGQGGHMHPPPHLPDALTRTSGGPVHHSCSIIHLNSYGLLHPNCPSPSLPLDHPYRPSLLHLFPVLTSSSPPPKPPSPPFSSPPSSPPLPPPPAGDSV